MTSQDQPEMPTNKGDDSLDASPDVEIDGLLARASALAAELSREVMEPPEATDDPMASEVDVVGPVSPSDTDPAAATPGEENDAGQSESLADSDEPLPAEGEIDQRLDDLESLSESLGIDMEDDAPDDPADTATDNASAEAVDHAADDADPEEGPSEGAGNVASIGGDLRSAPSPDAEFDLQAAARQLGLDEASPASPDNELDSPGDADSQSGAGSPEATLEPEDLLEPEASEDEKDGSAHGSDSNAHGRLAPLVGVLLKLEPVSLRVAEIGAGVLEKLDAPFGIVGERVRTMLGYVAIATVATSIIVFFASLL